MPDKVSIFGHDHWDYTASARRDYSDRNISFDYINVLEDEDGLQRMMDLNHGCRDIPVIVEDGRVTVGFGGSW